MADEIVNKVAQSGIITIDLEEFYPEGKRVLLDLKPFLFQELILKEKDFREQLKSHDWLAYKDAYVAVTCSADAIIPTWAYMLMEVYLQPVAKRTVFGTLETLEAVLYNEIVSRLDISPYKDGRIVIKGCSNKPVPVAAYLALTERLRPLAKVLCTANPAVLYRCINNPNNTLRTPVKMCRAAGLITRIFTMFVKTDRKRKNGSKNNGSRAQSF